MSFKRVYCIDTNIFIWIHKYYPKRLFPDLWRKLESYLREGRIISHQAVFKEICHSKTSKDFLAEWVSTYESSFHEINQRQLNLLPNIISRFPRLIDANRESEQADPWLIAQLLELNTKAEFDDGEKEYVLVTGESRKSPHKLPAACQHFGIEELDLIEFFEDNGWTFVMGNISF